MNATILSIWGIIKVLKTATIPGEHFRLIFTSTYYNHNHFAGFLELSLPFAICGALFYKSKKKYKIFQYGFLSILLFVCLVLTLSRGGIISFVCAFLLVTLIFTKDLKIFLPATIFAIIIIYFTLTLKPILEKIFSFEQMTLSGSSRMLLWKSTFYSLMEKPLMGWGPGNFTIAYQKYRDGIDGIVNYAHNDYLQAVVELGIPVAFALFAIILWWFVKGVTKIKTRHNMFFNYTGISAAMGAVSLGFHELVDFNLRIPSNAVLFALVFSIFILSTFVDSHNPGNNIKQLKLKSIPSMMFFSLNFAVLILSIYFLKNELWFSMAKKNFINGNLFEAERILEKLDRSHLPSPEYPHLHCRIKNTIANIENTENNLHSALTYCIKAFRIDNYNPFYAIDIADILKKFGREAEVINYIKTAVTVDPNNSYFRLILIEELLKLNRSEEALEYALNLAKKEPEKIPEILQRIKNNETLLNKFIHGFPYAVPEKILNFLFLNNLKDHYLSLFMDLYKQNVKLKDQKFYNIASDYLVNDKRFEEAVEILRAGINLFPEIPDGYVKLMGLLFYLKRYEDLLKLTDVTYTKLNLTEALYYRSLVYLNSGDFSRALKNAKLCVGRNVNDKRFRYLLYDIYMKMGMEYEAMQALGPPETFTPQDIHLILLRAELFEKWGKYDEAKNEYKRALAFQPDNPTASKKLLELELLK